jgi:MFS family permease
VTDGEPAVPAQQPPPPRRFARVRRLALDVTPLRSASYRRLWLGETVSAAGTAMTLVAVPLQVYAITRSSGYVGLTGLVTLVPLIGFGLFGGAIADAVERRKLLLWTQSLQLAAAGLLVLQAVAGLRNIWVLYALVALMSGVHAVDSPTQRAVLPRLVAPELLPAALAIEQASYNLALVLGPLLAGVLIAVGGVKLAYTADMLSFLASITAVLMLPRLPPHAGGTRAGAASVIEGLRFLRHQPTILMTFVVDIIAMVFGMPRALFPELAATRFGGGGRTAGLLYAAPAVGAMVGALLGGWLGRVNRQGLAVVAAIVAWGAAIIGFGLSPWLWLGFVFLAAAGFADMISAVYRGSIMQLAAPPQLLGRLSGVYIVVVAGGPRLGDLEAGSVSELFGPTFSVISGGVACIVGVVIAAALGRHFLKYDARDPSGERAAVAAGVSE